MKKIAVAFLFALAIIGPGPGAAIAQETNFVDTRGMAYETVAAGQTAQVLGGNGATGDYIDHVVIVPATAAGGVVTLIDGSTSISLYAGGGTTAAPSLMPVSVDLKMESDTGPWKITTGANISVIAVGRFSE